jgi:hypothetical protein
MKCASTSEEATLADPTDFHTRVGRDGEYSLDGIVTRTKFSIVYSGSVLHPSPDDSTTKITLKFIKRLPNVPNSEIKREISLHRFLPPDRHFLPVIDDFPFGPFGTEPWVAGGRDEGNCD